MNIPCIGELCHRLGFESLDVNLYFVNRISRHIGLVKADFGSSISSSLPCPASLGLHIGRPKQILDIIIILFSLIIPDGTPNVNLLVLRLVWIYVSTRYL